MNVRRPHEIKYKYLTKFSEYGKERQTRNFRPSKFTNRTVITLTLALILNIHQLAQACPLNVLHFSSKINANAGMRGTGNGKQ